MKLPKNTKGKPLIECKQCGKKFIIWPYLIKIRKFCSRKCETDWQKEQPGFNKGKKANLETRKKISLSLIGSAHHTKSHSEKTKSKLRLSGKKQWKNPVYREKMESFLKIAHKRASEVMKEKWSNKEFKERVLAKVVKELIKRPTSLEKRMIEIIEKHNLPYKYVGNGKFWIDGKNPDFVNINGEKKLIEVGNVYHHQGDYIEKRREHFAKYGWKSYIFIQDKLDEKMILQEMFN